jgi:tape measure domain-containing protein
MAVQDLEKLVVSLSADIAKFDRAMARAQGITNQRAKAIETRFTKMSGSIGSGAVNAAIAASKAFALIGGAQGFKTLSDAATGIDNALKVAGLSGAELERVYQSLFAAATKNAAPIETLVQLYSRVSLVQNELGVSTQDLTTFSNNVALALRVGGTSAQEASGALLQLSQALGGGVVRAEEFSSILEGAPTILQAVAAGIKEAEGSVAKLRQIMLDGKLSSKAFFDGFQAGAPVLEQKVAGAVYTIDQRLGNLKTALINAAREFNQSAKAGETFGSEIDRVSQFVNGLNFDSLITSIQSVTGSLSKAVGMTNTLYEAMGNLAGLSSVGEGLVDMLPGDGAKKSFLGGALTIQSNKGITDRINQAFEGEIQKAGELTEEALKQSVLGGKSGAPVNTTAKDGRLPEGVNPITLADPKYKPPASSKKGGKGSKKESDYAREIEQIKERTVALQAETEAQRGICGAIFYLEDIQ